MENKNIFIKKFSLNRWLSSRFLSYKIWIPGIITREIKYGAEVKPYLVLESKRKARSYNWFTRLENGIEH